MNSDLLKLFLCVCVCFTLVNDYQIIRSMHKQSWNCWQSSDQDLLQLRSLCLGLFTLSSQFASKIIYFGKRTEFYVNTWFCFLFFVFCVFFFTEQKVIYSIKGQLLVTLTTYQSIAGINVPEELDKDGIYVLSGFVVYYFYFMNHSQV